MTSIYHTPADPEGYDAAMRGQSYDSLDMTIPSMAEQIDAHNTATRDVDNGAEQVTINADPTVQDVVTAVFSGNGQTTFDVITNPNHYVSDRWPEGNQCKQFTRRMTFSPGNAFKYVWRHADKSKPIEDLGKAIEYLDWAIEDNAPVFAEWYTGTPQINLRNRIIAEVDAAVEYAVERSTDLVTRSAYSALSLIVRREYRLAQSTLRIVLL